MDIPVLSLETVRISFLVLEEKGAHDQIVCPCPCLLLRQGGMQVRYTNTGFCLRAGVMEHTSHTELIVACDEMGELGCRL